MNVSQFIAKWRKVELKERSAAQEFFIDLCRLVGHPTPAEADPTGADFCFEKGAAKHGGGDGFADVWKRGSFGWENKGRHKDLEAAFDQLLLYKDDLANPPLLVVCDMDRLVVRTNFTGTVPAVHELALEKLGEPRNLEILHHVFFDPEKLKPGKTSEAVTQDAADHFAGIADSMRARSLDAALVAHFLDRVVFCLFAEDIGLLPDMIFSRIAEKSAGDPARFTKLLGQLFGAMARGGDFGMETIRHFNGNLFDDCAALDLSPDEVARIAQATRLDWSAVDPTIFGTLFQRGLDPAMRAQLGAHFTGRPDIEEVVENVIMRLLRSEWAEARATIENLLTTGKKAGAPAPDSPQPLPDARRRKAHDEAASILHRFLVRLQSVKILDPACGSGNFLYVALLKLKDLEKEVILYAMDRGLGGFFPLVGPWQLHGLEINPYAFDLAQMTVWIGWLQWIRFNGFGQPQEPILRAMTGNFRCMDAVLDLTDPANPKEPEWPKADFIVGNPPFLGNKRMRSELGAAYTTALWRLYGNRIPAMSDLCCYWFEKARAMVEAGSCRQTGLLATTAIRQVGARRVLERIHDSCHIFYAVSDRDWILEGASVRISIVGFGGRNMEGPATLDGRQVNTIHASLTSGLDFTSAERLTGNLRKCFMGITKVGAFDIEESVALTLLSSVNPHGRPNSDVLRPFRNGSDIVRVDSRRWLIDFGAETPAKDAALYESPFELLTNHVKDERLTNGRASYRARWWIHGEARPAFRTAAALCPRYLATPRVAKHRLFVWFDSVVMPDSKVLAIALSDDFSLGVLQSHAHEIWTRATCGWHGLGNDVTYNPTTCFETFPFPESPTPNPDTCPATHAAIAAAARDLNVLRENWLNPPEWTREEILEFPGTVGGPWSRYIDPATIRPQPSTLDLQPFSTALVRYPRLIPRDPASAAKLAKRTLTNLYNQRPTWLADAHRRLDEAVAAAYGWPVDLTDEQILERLLALNHAAVGNETCEGGNKP